MIDGQAYILTSSQISSEPGSVIAQLAAQSPTGSFDLGGIDRRLVPLWLDWLAGARSIPYKATRGMSLPQTLAGLLADARTLRIDSLAAELEARGVTMAMGRGYAGPPRGRGGMAIGGRGRGRGGPPGLVSAQPPPAFDNNSFPSLGSRQAVTAPPPAPAPAPRGWAGGAEPLPEVPAAAPAEPWKATEWGARPTPEAMLVAKVGGIELGAAVGALPDATTPRILNGRGRAPVPTTRVVGRNSLSSSTSSKFESRYARVRERYECRSDVVATPHLERRVGIAVAARDGRRLDRDARRLLAAQQAHAAAVPDGRRR